jgi:hypothetical protein
MGKTKRQEQQDKPKPRQVKRRRQWAVMQPPPAEYPVREQTPVWKPLG